MRWGSWSAVAEHTAGATWGQRGLWRGLDLAGEMGTLLGTLQPCGDVCDPEPEEGSLGLWEHPGLGSKDSLGAGAACERTFSSSFRCLLRCMASPKTLTLFRSCAVAAIRKASGGAKCAIAVGGFTGRAGRGKNKNPNLSPLLPLFTTSFSICCLGCAQEVSPLDSWSGALE